MPSTPLHPPSREQRNGRTTASSNPLPQLLQTPCGLALLEIQGTLHTPNPNASSEITTTKMPVGRLVFPLYTPDSPEPEDQSWMKRVYLYVGKHQRMTGEIKKLPKAIAILRKSEKSLADAMDVDGEGSSGHGASEELEIAEIVRYKILFASRPEPVGD